MNKLNSFLEKILSSNFDNSLYKFTYLYNELFISIYNNKEFVLLGVSYKANKLLINRYCGDKTQNGKILLVILKKYEKIFLNLLETLNKELFKVGNEVEFINIYDNKKLSFDDIKDKLTFSFLDDYSYRRKVQNEFNFENTSILDIYHSDFECSKCSGPKEAFTSFQNFDNITDELYFPVKTQKTSKFLYTNVTDYESITIGGNDKIDEILSDKDLLDQYDLISLNKTCISVIMGDDINSIFKYNNIDSKKIFYTDQNTDSPYRAVINYLKNINIKNTSHKDEILFFGLNKNKNTHELIKFLDNNFGITVGNVLLPNINISDLETILDYNVSVFFTGRETKAQNIFKLYPISNFESFIPYGKTQFNTFCNTLFQKIGKIEYSNVLHIINQENGIKYKHLYEKAKKYEVGFIIDECHLDHFLKDNFRGVSILSLLNDMGFKINFFVNSDLNSDKYVDEIASFKILDHDIMFSTSKIELNSFIENSNIDLYYTEISNDKRILSKNKEQFSIGDLEYGIEGFYRTFELLIKKCEKVDYLKLNVNYYLNK